MTISRRPAKKVPLRDVAFFQEGPGLRTHQWAVDGMKVINVTNIIGDGSVDVTNTDKFVALDEFETRYAHFAVEENDLPRLRENGVLAGSVFAHQRKHVRVPVSVHFLHDRWKDRPRREEAPQHGTVSPGRVEAFLPVVDEHLFAGHAVEVRDTRDGRLDPGLILVEEEVRLPLLARIVCARGPRDAEHQCGRQESQRGKSPGHGTGVRRGRPAVLLTDAVFPACREYC